MNNSERDLWYSWHHLINEASKKIGHDKMGFMYDAKHAWEESSRLKLLFKLEREGALRKEHRQCSHCESESVHDNHLTCCLGVECRKCEFLSALDGGNEMTPEQRDEAKAWTCIAHILAKGGDMAGEGFILTTDDRMYWDTVYSHLASSEPPDVTMQQ